MARAGLEAAVWDVLAQSEGTSLADYLRKGQNYSQPRRDRVNVGVSIDIQSSVDETVKTVANYIQQGYQRIKLKIEPGWDVEVARAVRREFPDIALMLDANSAYTLKDASNMRNGRMNWTPAESSTSSRAVSAGCITDTPSMT